LTCSLSRFPRSRLPRAFLLSAYKRDPSFQIRREAGERITPGEKALSSARPADRLLWCALSSACERSRPDPFRSGLKTSSRNPQTRRQELARRNLVEVRGR